MENLDKILTKKQYDIYKLKLEGHTVLEIAKIVGCSHQNIYTIIANANKKIDAYNNFLSEGMSEEEAEREVKKKRRSSNVKVVRKNINARGCRKSKILIDYDGERKSLSDWCKYFNIEYKTAYARYRKGLSAEELFNTKVRDVETFDYKIKDEYDLSLISNEYRYILEQKNLGKSFGEIAKEFGCTRENIISKARIAISQLNYRENEYSEKARAHHCKHKNDEYYIQHKREKSMEFYQNHLEEERERNYNKFRNGGKMNNYQRKILKSLNAIESYMKNDEIELAKDCLNTLIENVKNDIRKTK